MLRKYRKIPKISPRAYIFQRPFLRGLLLEGLIFGGAYLRREICVSKSIGLALFSKYKPPGGLYLEGRFNGGFFLCSRFGGRIFGGAYFRNFKVVSKVIIIACDHLVVSKMPKKRRKNEENRLFSQNHRNQDSDNLGKCPWDSTATFRLFCHFWVPS